jgi:hypothetical protein
VSSIELYGLFPTGQETIFQEHDPVEDTELGHLIYSSEALHVMLCIIPAPGNWTGQSAMKALAWR